MKQQAHGLRADVAAAVLREAGASLGWKESSVTGARSSRAPEVELSKSGKPATLVAELAGLIDAGTASDWWLAHLSIWELTPVSATLSATFNAGRRVLASRTTTAVAAHRRATGGRLGRPPSIGPELLDRIASARQAGMSYRAIAADLESSGVPTPSGAQHWYASTVRAAHLRLLAAG